MSRVAIRARLIDIRMIERGPGFYKRRGVGIISLRGGKRKALFTTANINPCNFNAHDPAAEFQ